MKVLAGKVLISFFLVSTFLSAQVPFDRLRDADKEPGNWMTYSRTLNGNRYSPLKEINTKTVGRLKVRWAYQFSDGGIETSPLVVDGIVYITGPNSATAIDGRSGHSLWHWERGLPGDFVTNGFGRVNRGAAVLDEKLFIATLDGYLVALDLKSGSERWLTKVADYKKGYAMTVAPLAVEDKVIVGVSGGDAGVRGFVDAYQASSGKQAWRFWTIPAPGEPGSETWSGNSWKTGGGATWITGAYDPDLKLVYWGVGNPGPDWDGDVRPGDNLYTCSFVALDVETGKLRWHFQFTPHDTHDWDSTHVPILFDGNVNGKKRKLMAVANRNAFYYVLDRTSGEFIAGRPYARESWAKGLDAKGRPIVNPNSDPTEEGAVIWPNANGATDWLSPSYNPQTDWVYVPVREMGAKYFKHHTKFSQGQMYGGGGEEELPPDDSWGAIKALQAETGDLKWEFKLLSPPWAGVLSTAGGLVFSGSNEGNFFALDARTGKPLWDFQTGGWISANPISFTIDGHQCIAIAANRVLFVFSL